MGVCFYFSFLELPNTNDHKLHALKQNCIILLFMGRAVFSQVACWAMLSVKAPREETSFLVSSSSLVVAGSLGILSVRMQCCDPCLHHHVSFSPGLHMSSF